MALKDIIDRNLHDVAGYDVTQIAQEAYNLGRKDAFAIVDPELATLRQKMAELVREGED